ncbi:MAG: CBS domain-containing protein [Kangiellaceae bacterium]|jgi:CBS domain-containing protein|nr:CBS domain-containing protein [Kangiellaceae bacterium]
MTITSVNGELAVNHTHCWLLWTSHIYGIQSMDKAVVSLVAPKPVKVGVDDNINTVIETLDKNKLPCVPVVDADGKCFGVISASDLVHFQKMNFNPKIEHAWELCTHNFIEVSSDVSVKQVAELMVKNKIHHIVISDNSVLKGIVSSLDILESGLLNN